MVVDTYTPRTLTEDSHSVAVSAESTDELLNPQKHITLIVERQIRILRRSVQLSQCTKTVSNTCRGGGLAVGD